MSAAMRLPSRMGTITLRSMMATDSSSDSVAVRLATSSGSTVLLGWDQTGITEKNRTMRRPRAVFMGRKCTAAVKCGRSRQLRSVILPQLFGARSHETAEVVYCLNSVFVDERAVADRRSRQGHGAYGPGRSGIRSPGQNRDGDSGDRRQRRTGIVPRLYGAKRPLGEDCPASPGGVLRSAWHRSVEACAGKRSTVDGCTGRRS